MLSVTKRASEIFLLVLLVLAIGAQVRKRAFSESVPEPKPGLLAGERVEAPAGVDFGRREQTLLITLAPKCSYCVESLPFYRRLSALPSGARDRVQLVGLVRHPEDLAAEARSLDQYRVALDQLVQWDFRSMGVYGTPTLVLLGPGGQVRKVWRGLLSAREEVEVLSTLHGKRERGR